MRGFLFICLFSLSTAVNIVRKPRLPRLGPTLEEVDFNNLEPELKILKKEAIEDATRLIRQRIEQINAKLSETEKDTLLAEATKEDPVGFKCEKQILNITEISFVEQVRCYNTTEQVCSMTHKTVFEARTEKRCDIHFKKECWIDYKEQSKSQTINVCTTKPERKCDLTAAEKEAFGKTECNTYYETVCQTKYIEKNVVEDRPVCNDIVEEMCDENKQNCMQFTRKECSTQKITTKKQIPNTSCDQVSREICVTPACPLVVENKVCQDVEKTFVTMVPKESCELHPREVCTDIVKQYPSLQMVTDCQYLPRETCSPERVQPKEITRPVIKKVCTATDLTNTVGELTCPTDDARFGLVDGRCVYFEGTKLPYDKAIENCQEKMKEYGRGILYEPYSIAEQKRTVDMAVEQGLKYPVIGVTDIDNEGQYTYNSNKQPINFNPDWKQGFGSSGSSNLNCIGIDSDKAYSDYGKWVDLPCTGYTHTSICSAQSIDEPTQPPPTTTLPANSGGGAAAGRGAGAGGTGGPAAGGGASAGGLGDQYPEGRKKRSTN